ncbi:MAG: hypothetical protein HRU25_13385 [Psychrobium sp.]|nr:hypothetical protein [Psychrobium sp.]
MRHLSLNNKFVAYSILATALTLTGCGGSDEEVSQAVDTIVTPESDSATEHQVTLSDYQLSET